MIARLSWMVFITTSCVFLLSPLILLALFCFSNDRAIALPITSFGFKWWGELLGNPTFWPSARNSLIVSCYPI